MTWKRLNEMNTRDIIPVPVNIQKARVAANAYTKHGKLFISISNNGKTYIERVR